MSISFRLINSKEYFFLEEILYEALFVPEGEPQFPKSIIYLPDIKKYISDWGSKENDVAIIAYDEAKLIGAVWGRIFPYNQKGYGYVNEQTPEISMAITDTYRNKGIGTELLKQIEQRYIESGISQLSLSVNKLNPAKRLYHKAGYQIHKEQENSVTMLKKLVKEHILIFFF